MEMRTEKSVTRVNVQHHEASQRQNCHPDVMHESRLRHFLAPVGFTEIPVGYARM